MGLFMLDFKVDRLEAMELVEKTYPISGDFSNISILTSDYDVNLLPAEDGVPRLVSKEARRVRHSMEVTDGTLSIQIQDDRGFRDRIGIFIQSPSMTLYLPESSYETLLIETTSGSIHLQTSAGNSIQAKTTSGSIHLRDILASCSLSLSSTSGGIRLSKCDAPEIQIKTTSGSVTGQLLTPKYFKVDTNSGTVSVPYAVAAEICRIETTSGSVRFAEPGE